MKLVSRQNRRLKNRTKKFPANTLGYKRLTPRAFFKKERLIPWGISDKKRLISWDIFYQKQLIPRDIFIVSHLSMTEYLSPERALSVRVCVCVSVCPGL